MDGWMDGRVIIMYGLVKAGGEGEAPQDPAAAT